MEPSKKGSHTNLNGRSRKLAIPRQNQRMNASYNAIWLGGVYPRPVTAYVLWLPGMALFQTISAARLLCIVSSAPSRMGAGVNS